MLKKTINYKNFNDEDVSEDFYFHLSEAEIVEMEVSEKGGLSEHLTQIVKSGDQKEIIEKFKWILKISVGKKSADGNRFIKNSEIVDDFLNSPAFSEMFVQLATDASAAAEFINGIMPAKIAGNENVKSEIAKAMAEKIAEKTDGPIVVENTPSPINPTAEDIRNMSDEEFKAWQDAKNS